MKILADVVSDGDVVFAQGAGNIGDIAQRLASTSLDKTKLLAAMQEIQSSEGSK
jgi:UDP-N-acetylmuramate--alanine ligase